MAWAAFAARVLRRGSHCRTRYGLRPGDDSCSAHILWLPGLSAPLHGAWKQPRLAHRHGASAKWTGTVQIQLSRRGGVRDPDWERGTEATASTWEATGEQSGGGLSWGKCRAPDVLPSASAARHDLSLTLAMAYLKPEMGRLHGKGKMLPNRGRPRRFRERKIAPEHRHHRFDFEQRQVASGTH